MKTNDCPRCFGPRPATAIYAGSLCPRCAAECEKERERLRAAGDVATLIIDKAIADGEARRR